MANWRSQLKHDPLPPLLSSGNEALQYFARRDLLGQRVGPVSQLWELPEAQRILRRQLVDGSWPRSGVEKHHAVNYHLVETWRNFRFLVQQYGFTREHPQAQQAAEFIFSCQLEGSLRSYKPNMDKLSTKNRIAKKISTAGCCSAAWYFIPAEATTRPKIE